jgi:YVTN family beta-propeller protein
MATRLCFAIAASVILCWGCSRATTPQAPATAQTPHLTEADLERIKHNLAAIPQRTRAHGGPLDVYADTRPGMLSPLVAGTTPLVYVPNSISNTVSVIDPQTFTVVRTFVVGFEPQHITPAWDMQTLYVDDTRGNTLIPIDPTTGLPGQPIPVADPYNLYFTPDGTKAIVVAERNRSLDIRDPKTWALLASIPMPCKGADHGDFTADERYFLVSCEYSGKLIKVDMRLLRVDAEMDLGGSPIDVRLSPDGQVIYVANQGSRFGGVQLVDPVRMQLIGYIPTGAGAHGEILSRDGRSLYVTNRLGHTVSVIDFSSRTVAHTWVIPGGSPDMGGVSSDGSQLWLSGRYNREVYVLDTQSGSVLKRIRVGVGPHGLCLFPQPGRYSLGHTGNYR